MTASGEEPVTCVCGRELTDPESVSRGLGPVCRRKLHGRTARRPRTTSVAGGPAPDQPELPLDDQLPLWSA